MTINLRLASKHRQQAEHQAAFSAAANLLDSYDPNHLLFLPSGTAEFIGTAGLKQLATGKGAMIGSGLGALAGTGIFETEEEKQNTSALSRLAKVAGGASLGQGAGMGVQAGIGAAKKRFGRTAKPSDTIPQPGKTRTGLSGNSATPVNKPINPLDPKYQTIDV